MAGAGAHQQRLSRRSRRAATSIPSCSSRCPRARSSTAPTSCASCASRRSRFSSKRRCSGPHGDASHRHRLAARPRLPEWPHRVASRFRRASRCTSTSSGETTCRRRSRSTRAGSTSRASSVRRRRGGHRGTRHRVVLLPQRGELRRRAGRAVHDQASHLRSPAGGSAAVAGRPPGDPLHARHPDVRALMLMVTVYSILGTPVLALGPSWRATCSRSAPAATGCCCPALASEDYRRPVARRLGDADLAHAAAHRRVDGLARAAPRLLVLPHRRGSATCCCFGHRDAR